MVVHAYSNGKRLCNLVQGFVRGTQSLILRARPSYWPTIFCVLLLLRLIQSNSSSGMDYFDDVCNGADAIRDVWKKLSVMFEVASGSNLHPLVNG